MKMSYRAINDILKSFHGGSPAGHLDRRCCGVREDGGFHDEWMQEILCLTREVDSPLRRWPRG